MKQSLITILCLLLLLFVSCRNETGVTIRGEISNLEFPYILATHISADVFVIDTILVENRRGRFTYRAEIDTATVFTLYINDFTNSVVFFADRGQRISVRGDAQLTKLIQITGNETNNELTAFRQENEDLLRERHQLVSNFSTFNTTDTIEIYSYTTLREMLRLNTLDHELSLRAEEFIADNPTRLSSLILINDFFTDNENPQALERVLNYLEGDDVLRTRLARQLQNLSERLNISAEGRHTPYFELISTKNDTIRSHNLLEKYLFLSFISTEGIESRQMIKSLKESYEALSDTARFVSIFIDSDTFPITHLESDSITWSVVVEQSGWNANVVNLLNIQSVPFTVLISPRGVIYKRNILPQQVVELVRPDRIDEGVVINGVRWATRNASAFRTFVKNPEDFGMLFQWNRRRAWNATDENVTGWNRTAPTGTEWEAANDPCPPGWRVPTDAELESLEQAGSEWTAQNGVNGRLFGVAPYQIFLPAAGLRNTVSGARDNVGSSGHYWSSTSGGAARAMGLGFCSGISGVNHRSRLEGLSVRCVAKN